MEIYTCINFCSSEITHALNIGKMQILGIMFHKSHDLAVKGNVHVLRELLAGVCCQGAANHL